MWRQTVSTMPITATRRIGQRGESFGGIMASSDTACRDTSSAIHTNPAALTDFVICSRRGARCGCGIRGPLPRTTSPCFRNQVPSLSRPATTPAECGGRSVPFFRRTPHTSGAPLETPYERTATSRNGLPSRGQQHPIADAGSASRLLSGRDDFNANLRPPAFDFLHDLRRDDRGSGLLHQHRGGKSNWTCGGGKSDSSHPPRTDSRLANIDVHVVFREIERLVGGTLVELILPFLAVAVIAIQGLLVDVGHGASSALRSSSVCRDSASEMSRAKSSPAFSTSSA